MDALDWLIGLMMMLCGAAFGCASCWLYWSRTPPSPTDENLSPEDLRIYEDSMFARRVMRAMAYPIVIAYVVLPLYVGVKTHSPGYTLLHSLGMWLGSELAYWIFHSQDVYTADEDLTEILTDDPPPEPSRSLQPS